MFTEIQLSKYQTFVKRNVAATLIMDSIPRESGKSKRITNSK